MTHSAYISPTNNKVNYSISRQEYSAVALNKAMTISVHTNISVEGPGAHLIIFVRMHDAFLGFIDIAIQKAKRLSYLLRANNFKPIKWQLTLIHQ